MIHKSDNRKGKTKKQNRRLGYSESPSTLRSKEKENQQLSDPCTPVMNITHVINRLKAET